MSTSVLTIKESDSGAEYTIDYLQPGTRATTYSDLLSVLSRVHHLSTSYHQLLYTDDSGAQSSLNLSDPITAAHPTLLLHPIQYDLRVQHYSLTFPSTDSAVFDVTTTIAQVKSHFSRDMEEPCTILTHDGVLLPDGARLYDLPGLSSAAVNTLHSKLSVVITDVETERQTTVDELHSAMTVADLKLHYSTKEKRVNIDKAELTFRHDEDDSETLLQDSQTLHSANIHHDSELHLKTPPYPISIKEGTTSYDITVFDHYTPHQLKEEYNKLTTNPLTSGDSLIYNDEQISDTTELYKLRMKERAVVYITREDTSLARFDYLCADCGNDVKIKKTDAIRCRECGHRILFKKRTTKPCQYLCR